MQNTIKRTDLPRSRHYEHNGETPKMPKKPTNPEDDGRMLCPMSCKPCLHTRCMLWDEHWGNCSMNPMSLYNQIRDAVTDAGVDVVNAYNGGDYSG